MRTGSDKKGTETSLGTVDRREAIVLEQDREKALNKVLSRNGVVSTTADERIERIPVGTAELGQSGSRFRS
jgi:hypothetical protein